MHGVYFCFPLTCNVILYPNLYVILLIYIVLLQSNKKSTKMYLKRQMGSPVLPKLPHADGVMLEVIGQKSFLG